jgi:hypothetical protein
MQQWEYLVINNGRGIELDVETMNNLGAQGWELVFYSNEFNSLVFKRPKS